jgi:hypothetical protein
MPLRLTFDTPHQTAGTIVRDVVNQGTADVASVMVTDGGGQWRSVDRHGQSIETPAYRPGSDAPVAILRVTPVGEEGDALAPGYSSFEFGAEFRLDAVSDGSSTDNGDNLMQRGLSGDEAQFKLQLDHQRPACRIKGSAGAVQVVSPSTVPAFTWFRAACRRFNDRVVLTVTELQSGEQTVTTVDGHTGSLRPESADVPLSIGGKLNAHGGIVSSSDQYNGFIDDVFLRVY